VVVAMNPDFHSRVDLIGYLPEPINQSGFPLPEPVNFIPDLRRKVIPRVF